MDDPAARLPEAQPEAGGHRSEEVVDLGVLVLGHQQVGLAVHPGLDEVVAVDR